MNQEPIEPEELEVSVDHRREGKKADDKLSKSQRLCGCCLVGPRDKSLMPKIANVAMILAMGMNGFCLVHLWLDWAAWLTIANLALGALTLVLMWTVQCSDPGI